ncbi:Rrf2 family transcriptional regulator [Mogibacterium sp.]
MDYQINRKRSNKKTGMQITSKFTIAIHILACIDYFHGKIPVNSKLLAESIGSNPVIIRGVMSSLNKAGIINAERGKRDISIQKELSDITFYDIYLAVDSLSDDGLFHFHENPNLKCPVGSKIHIALDDKLERVQVAMENEMKNISVESVIKAVRHSTYDRNFE